MVEIRQTTQPVTQFRVTKGNFDDPVDPGKCTSSILIEADALIHGDRAQQYGDVKVNFGRWARLCNEVGIEVTAQELAMIMVMGKLARQVNKHKKDNITDACGYLGLYDELE